MNLRKLFKSFIEGIKSFIGGIRLNSKKIHLMQFFRSFNLENVKINPQGPSVELSFKPEDANAALGVVY